jgi:DNA-binding transcriptional LysR family regulator
MHLDGNLSMDLQDMRYFLAVAEEQNFGRAAERLYMTQPPLSRHIKALEERLGVLLFERTHKGVVLTAAGQALQEDAPKLLAQAQRAKMRTQRAGMGMIGQLDVGLFGSGILDVIPRILAQFHTARPDVKIHLHNMNKAEQLQALREFNISVGFNRLVPPQEDLVVELLLREPLIVAIPEGHPLSARSSIRLAELDDVPQILYPNIPIRGLAQALGDVFRREGLILRIEQEVEDVFTAVALVAAGFGICIAPQSAMRLRLPGVTFRSLEDSKLCDVDLSCLYRRGDASPVLMAFLDVVRQHTGEMRGPIKSR